MKKVIYSMLALLLLLILTLSIAVPAMAVNQPSTIINISASDTEVVPDSTIQLFISETNDGVGNVQLHDVYIDLFADDILIDQLTNKSPSFTGGDADYQNWLQIGETWTWTYEVTVSDDTRYTVIGHGITAYEDITYPTYAYEMAYVDVKVVSWYGGWPCSFWKFIQYAHSIWGRFCDRWGGHDSWSPRYHWGHWGR